MVIEMINPERKSFLQPFGSYSLALRQALSNKEFNQWKSLINETICLLLCDSVMQGGKEGKTIMSYPSPNALIEAFS